MGKSDEKPKGGYDSTPLNPSSGPTFTIQITFHSASNLPIADLRTGSCDPFVLAQLNTDLPTRHKEDPKLRFRSQTVHRTVEPQWEARWVVAGVPASGFELRTRVYDEDRANFDDRLGMVVIRSGPLDEGWKGVSREEFEVKMRGGDVLAYGLRWGKKLICRGTKLHANLVISIEMLGKTEEEIGKTYTVNNFWWKHYSPMIGRLAGVKSNNDQGIERYNFQANELQLRGPVPPELYHRYVEFKPFVASMFTGKGIRGRFLHQALHHQHERIYMFDSKTEHGTLPGPGDEMTLRFLDMVHYDQGGRIFTYVITLDGLFRFTETGKEFGIDLLSKHTMHSDVNIYIAWSGEFLIRRLSKPKQRAEDPDQHTHPAEDVPGGPPTDDPPKDPKHYELVIDNDSGTYRPDASLLPILKKFLKRNFPNLHIVVKACDDDKLKKIKEDQLKIKKKEGDHLVFGQGSDSGSISSSDEEELNARADQDGYVATGAEKAFEAISHPGQALKSALGKGKDSGGASGEKAEKETERGEGEDKDKEGEEKGREGEEKDRGGEEKDKEGEVNRQLADELFEKENGHSAGASGSNPEKV